MSDLVSIKETWAQFGVATQQTKDVLAGLKEKALAQLNIEVTKDNVVDAESRLKEAKNLNKQIVESRKALTDKLDAVKSKLMLTEKEIADALPKLENSIISVKREIQKEHDVKEALRLAKLTEQQNVDRIVANFQTELQSIVNKRLYDAYNFALENKQEDLLAYKRSVITKIAKELPEFKKPQTTYPETVIAEIQSPIFDFDSVFLNYEIDLQNVELAKAKAKADAEAKAAQAKADADMAELNLQMQAAASAVPEIVSEVKALKKVYKIEMPETYENAMLILAAFMANQNLTREKTSTTKWFAFNANSAKTALERVKADDNNFQPKGINFVEVDKL